MASRTTVISRQDLQGNTTSAASITEVKPLSSYSWIEAPVPTIAVPGIPPRWTPPSGQRRLPKDSGLVYIAQNAARHPSSPIEPLFRALFITQPTFDILATDVVTDRNNIRKLMSFVDPSSSRNGLEPFVIDVEVTKHTAIFSRMETKTKEIIEPHEFKGYGHEFEKAYTTDDIDGSTGHHRIVSYKFSGLNFIVRHEVDGYVKGHAEASSSGKGRATDDISSLMGDLSLSTAASTAKTSRVEGSKLFIREEGHIVPIESTLEIKTRVAHKPLNLQEIAPQLWTSQTLKLVRAYHTRGIFQEPRVEDVSADIRRWEQGNQANLRNLAALIKKIISVTKGYGGRATVKYDAVRGYLVIRETNDKPMLPKDLYSKWDGGDDSEEKPQSDLGEQESKVRGKSTDAISGKASKEEGV
ncbi:geranylgeranyl pyrophosphate synthetase [Annulohypoxylon maeteangense]|uniref:geranylgeranyl pyrophosphate synthetase n=1 Tax=Annulohypoxylon maeteangense TaxID=1927788 RepID=UPI0020087C8A|nr:geranylgeranyl pyrophosphate synthetase [Annulohypoxylon maeteangense]KAI0884331.1 geranylgeranyl pyrophosphate synthetase [Annulohypoxylon maeteangense]